MATLDETTRTAQLLGKALSERDRARALAVRLEGICHVREGLLWEAIAPPESHAQEAELGRRIARHLRETSSEVDWNWPHKAPA
jgi:hypothetical protein